MRREDKAGLQFTIIVHLVVLIVLLCLGIGRELVAENSFVLDFTHQEELEKKERLELMEESVSRKLDEMIAQAKASSDVRNVAISRNSLSDDRHSAEEAKRLYEDADKLAQDLKNGYKSDIEEDAGEEVVEYKKENTQESQPYSGPSVLSWTLEGRKASHLPIPAYRCYGAGEVTVAITVDPQGKVQNAKIIDEVSTADDCLRRFAIRAARLSRFSLSATAPSRQAGEIVYQFIAQ